MGWTDPASLQILKSINAITIKLETWMGWCIACPKTVFFKIRIIR